MNTKTTPKDFFLHIGATVALYVSVISLVNLSFSIINKILPDQLTTYFNVSSIIWPISILIILVPVLYIIEWFIAKDISKIVEKKDIWIRRWRIYLTLFLTGSTIVGDLVTVINTYLNGEITTRFVYKVLVILFICGAVFKYYFFSINENMKWSNMVKKYIPWFGIILVLVVIIAGFIIVGSPAKQRAIRFDEQRVNDISNLAYSIAHYWQESGTVPDSFSSMPEYGTFGVIPKDPVTNIPYEYKKGDTDNSFLICTTFSESSDKNGNTYPKSVSAFYDWTHPAGYYCFDKTISSVDFPSAKQSILSPSKI